MAALELRGEVNRINPLGIMNVGISFNDYPSNSHITQCSSDWFKEFKPKMFSSSKVTHFCAGRAQTYCSRSANARQ